MSSDKETAGGTHCPNCGEPYLGTERERESTEYVHSIREHEQGGTVVTESCTVASGYEKGNDAEEMPELFEEAHEAVERLHGQVDTFPVDRQVGDAREQLINAESNWEWNNGN